MRDDAVTARIAHEYSGEDFELAVSIIDSVCEGYGVVRGRGSGMLEESTRVEEAMLIYAEGDLDLLQEAADLALTDWRDLLVWTQPEATPRRRWWSLRRGA